MSGYVYIALTVLFWGVWGFFGKLATRYNSPICINSIVWLLSPAASLLFFALMRSRNETLNHSAAATWLIALTGLSAVMGTTCYYFALSRLPASLVVSLTALYPALTVCLALLFLGERFTALQAGGLALVLAGVILLGVRT